MNLLVTNTRNAQAYAVTRALRAHAAKIVATMEGDNRFAAHFSHAANSRLVDKRYYTPSPATDWRAGRIQRENTSTEEAYIQIIEKICEQESIDTIFPSFDPHVYVFSKNKQRLARRGVLIPIPDYDVVIAPLDKYRTVQLALEVGFPCPKTYLPQCEEDLKGIANELGFPLVVKPRFGSTGSAVGIVNDLPELLATVRLVREKCSMPIVQEYIPGKRKQHPYLVLDKKSELSAAFVTRRWRHLFRVTSNIVTADESMPIDSCVLEATRLVQKLGWWGGITVEMKVDPRDGIPKLMEINTRFGARLWVLAEADINAPWMCLKIARGEEVQAQKDYRLGIFFLDPVEEIFGLGFRLLDLLIYECRLRIQGKLPLDPFNRPMTAKELIESYKKTYLGSQEKIFNPYFKYFFQDPLVSVLWWFQFCALALRCTKQLGR